MVAGKWQDWDLSLDFAASMLSNELKRAAKRQTKTKLKFAASNHEKDLIASSYCLQFIFLAVNGIVFNLALIIEENLPQMKKTKVF